MLPEILIVGLLCVSVVVMIIVSIMRVRENGQLDGPVSRMPEETAADREILPQEVAAMVVDYSCAVKMVGIQTPKTVKEFTVVFKTDAGDILRFEVPEEMYDGFEKGQRGLLTVVDGALYSFVLDEE